jgi:hypothetical protein
MRIFLLLFTVFVMLLTGVDRSHGAQEKNEAEAPPNHSIINSDRGGAHFVPNELFERYETLKSQIELLKLAIDQDRPDAQSAADDVRLLLKDYADLQQEIQAAQVFVSPMQQYVQTDTYEFELGKERRVVVVADGVRIETWDGDRIRCEVKKSILGKEQPSEDQFGQIYVQHSLGRADDLVGITSRQRTTDEKTYDASSEGQALTQEQRENRTSLVEEIATYWERYSEFQGKPINVLQLKGVSGQEGNEHIVISVKSKGGTGSMGSHWRRHAEMTIFLPKDVHVAVLGCQTSVDVRNLTGSILLTADQSHDRDYDGSFSVDGVTGDVTVHDAPIRSIRHVGGSVMINAVGEMRNGGTHHSGGMRSRYVDRSTRTTIQDVSGDLKAVYLDTNLHVERIGGSIDVVNRHGTTEVFVAEAPPTTSHRVLSDSGRIHIRGPSSVINNVQWYLLSQVGDVRVNVPRRVLKDVSFKSGEAWGGFFPAPDPAASDPMAFYNRMQRPKQILANSERSAGFDVLSRSGRIVLEAEE